MVLQISCAHFKQAPRTSHIEATHMSVNPALLGIVSSIAELVTAHTVQENIKSKNKLADSVFKDTPAKSPESIRDSTNHLFQDSGVRATPKIAPWGEMTSFELTSSNEKDIQALTLREFTDPKRFYRKNTIHSRKSAGPTKFQVLLLHFHSCS